MDRIEELKEQIKQYEAIARDANFKIQGIKAEMLAMTKKETEKYYHKYIKFYPTDYQGYVHYLYVESCESDYEGSWILNGHGFTTYVREDLTIKFETTSLTCGGLHLANVEKGYDTVEFITPEEFYDEREKAVKQLLEERYD